MSQQHIIVEARERVGLIQLNRPKGLNALNDALMDELGAALLKFDADDNIGAIVITGNDKAFAAGADIGAMSTWTYMDVFKTDYITRNWETLRRVRKPVIAAVGGLLWRGVNRDDVRHHHRGRFGKFGQPEIKLGIIPGAGGTSVCPEQLAKPRRWTWC